MGLFGSGHKSARHAQKRYFRNIEKLLEKYGTWTDERREGMMKGIQGYISNYINAGQEKAASTGADLGRGGGYYGSSSEKLRRAGLEYGAQALAKTYEPINISGLLGSYGTSSSESDWGDVLGNILGLGGGLSLSKLILGD